ncbi:hypothetical protein D3C71_1345240 [compost metagenome]
MQFCFFEQFAKRTVFYSFIRLDEPTGESQLTFAGDVLTTDQQDVAFAQNNSVGGHIVDWVFLTADFRVRLVEAILGHDVAEQFATNEIGIDIIPHRMRHHVFGVFKITFEHQFADFGCRHFGITVHLCAGFDEFPRWEQIKIETRFVLLVADDSDFTVSGPNVTTGKAHDFSGPQFVGWHVVHQFESNIARFGETVGCVTQHDFALVVGERVLFVAWCVGTAEDHQNVVCDACGVFDIFQMCIMQRGHSTNEYSELIFL